MAIFGRDKDEDDDYEDDDELDEKRGDTLQERKLKRELRDLKKENRRKRKEPVKLWGKRERLIILIILGVTVVASAILALSSSGVGRISFSGLNLNFSMPDFSSLNIFKTETIEIRKK